VLLEERKSPETDPASAENSASPSIAGIATALLGIDANQNHERKQSSSLSFTDRLFNKG
jgi:hypothetical protein